MPSPAATLRAQLPAIAALANSPRRDRGATRAIYSYPAKFQAHLPAELIRLFTRPGDLVVDPYCGGGTTGLEAFLLGRPALGVDLNPFACLLARVKTARRSGAPAPARGSERNPLDEEDTRCLGARISREIASLCGSIDATSDPADRDLLRVALIHAIKIAGRRDFDDDSLLPTFERRLAFIARAAAALPDGPPPRVRCGSNHAMPELADGAARLVVTSPPYKDLDVEYGLLQIQRPALRRSKRSRVIWRILGADDPGKRTLCGGAGEAYFQALAPSLREIRRILARGAPAFFWTGFKDGVDRDRFLTHLGDAGLQVVAPVQASLSGDRVASSRSTHHGRATGMLGHDWLIACIASH